MSEVWTIGRILQWTAGHFGEKRLGSPRLDAELLLAHALGKDRLYLYTHYDQPLTQSERDAYRALVQRRLRHEPVAYILGEREFYGLAFAVTRDVLIPRPETEHLVDAVREWVEGHALVAPRIVDVGTGSGAIAVAVAHFLPAASVVAIDVSAPALAVAKTNAARHGVEGRLRFVEGHLVEPLVGEPAFDVIAANLPYVPERDRASLMPDVRDHEPPSALFAGEDGLLLVRELVATAAARLAAPGLLALEIGAGQWPAVRELILQSGAFSAGRAVADLEGHARVALAER